MPALSNPKHEIIAQRLAAGDSQVAACVAAGLTADSANANRRCKRPDILERAAELRGKVAKTYRRKIQPTVEQVQEQAKAAVAKAQEAIAEAEIVVTVATLTAHLDAIRRDAHAAGKYGPAVSAIREIGRLHGLTDVPAPQPEGPASMTPWEYGKAVVEAVSEFRHRVGAQPAPPMLELKPEEAK